MKWIKVMGERDGHVLPKEERHLHALHRACPCDPKFVNLEKIEKAEIGDAVPVAVVHEAGVIEQHYTIPVTGKYRHRRPIARFVLK